jgi:hypothetical protein
MFAMPGSEICKAQKSEAEEVDGVLERPALPGC